MSASLIMSDGSFFGARLPKGLDEYLMSLTPWQRALPKGCLHGKRVLVTGIQNLSIGGAAAHGLASHCDAEVILHSYSMAEIEAVMEHMQKSGNARRYPHYVVDFQKPDEAWDLGKKILCEHGAPFAVLNIAGITEFPDITKLEPNSQSTAMVERVLNINYVSPLRLVGALVENMIEQHTNADDPPRIICTSSVHSDRACSAGNATYAATKNGQECIARDLANDPRFVGKLIAVALEFGWIDVIRHRSNDEIFTAMKQAMLTMPSRRIPTASEAALQYARLLLDNAAGYQGTTIRFDSGRGIICP